ncbi:MAG: hypothetical protein CMO81_05815 [Waddliaceae bacterium]|nr:hypothetical protein [Waddliaceae bacterium]
MGKTVCIGGLIAVGKSTFLKSFCAYAEEQGASIRGMPEMYPESVRQMVHSNLVVGEAFFLAHRLQMAVDAQCIAKSYDLVFMERSIIDHMAFLDAFEECHFLEPEQINWSRQVIKEVNPPKLDRFIFLDISPELAFKRKSGRGRGGEQFTLPFLHCLRESYLNYLHSTYSDPLILDWSAFGEELNRDELLSALLSIE